MPPEDDEEPANGSPSDGDPASGDEEVSEQVVDPTGGAADDEPLTPDGRGTDRDPLEVATSDRAHLGRGGRSLCGHEWQSQTWESVGDDNPLEDIPDLCGNCERVYASQLDDAPSGEDGEADPSGDDESGARDVTEPRGDTALSRARREKEPPDDVEMPLTDHIEEMLNRLVIVAVIGGAATLLAVPFASDIVITMWYDIHPGDVSTCVPDPDTEGCTPPHLYHPLEQVLTEIKVAALAGIVAALPAFVYQTYQFMRPGLYPHERRYYLASVPMSLVLAVVGMAFAYFIILPLLFSVFLFYSEGSAEIAFALADTFDIMLMLMIVLAIVFQIPLFIMLAIMMGVTTRRWLERQRIYFWIAFAGIAFVFTVDPTGMAPVLVAITMIALFEGTLALLRWTGR